MDNVLFMILCGIVWIWGYNSRMPRVCERGAAARQTVSHEKSISRGSNIPAAFLPYFVTFFTNVGNYIIEIYKFL